ncbi:MAG: amino acid adenylation domain-containing protein [Paludibacter sp.]|nr:amino acid adenylation domain-containing protein [Paludibacter sp.]
MKTNITDYIKDTAFRFPDKVAVKDTKGEISFSQLMEAGKKVATQLLGMQISREPIAVFMPKNKEAIISFLGINYSGNFYVPLDVKSPQSRVNSILQVLESDIVITDKDHYEQLKVFCSKVILVIEDILANQKMDEFAIKSIIDTKIDTDPIYSIFTSGSTGTPKGVVISHRGVIDYIDWAVCTFKIDETAVIGNQAPFYFDNSTLDIYLMYATGATLVIIPEDLYIFPARLIDHLNENKVSFVFWVPFVLVNIANLNIFATKKPKYLRDVIFAGEVMPNKHLNYWRKHMPDCRYANLYGPTEITVDCTYYVVEREFSDDEPLPIGYPCRNSDILIMTEKDEVAKMNEQGELCVRGTSIALGYYNDWEKTQKVFVQNPLNKHYPELIYRTGDLVYMNELREIIFVGRKDAQIKHNGYRIELGEIEAAVLGTQLVDICSVVYDNMNKQIVLFYEAKFELPIGDFRKKMLGFVPKYMLPTIISKVDKMPLNSNGKIDRVALNKKVNFSQDENNILR